LKGLDVVAFNLSKADLSILEHELVENQKPTHAFILDKVLTRYAYSKGKKLYGEKTPGHLPYVPTIARIFPDSKFISVIRDPRDVDLSLDKVTWDKGNSFNHAIKWNHYARLSTTYLENFGKNFIEIKYENLISEDEKTVNHICAFLDLNFDASMLNFFEEDVSNFSLSKEPWKVNAAKKIDTTNMMKWERELPISNRIVFNLVASKMMNEKDYLTPKYDKNLVLVREVSKIILIGTIYELKRVVTKLKRYVMDWEHSFKLASIK